MADYITLLGAEDVSRAANSMRDAASTMSSAASSMVSAVEFQQRVMDDWLNRFEAVLEKHAK
jgi:RecA/RadA recombinase